jgi:hypothetical protein
MMTRAIPALFGLFALVSTVGTEAMAASVPQHSPVVVELFTSQGCSSCPPAEAFLGELAKRKDVIALEYHVNYWDYIGWKDTFAKPAFGDRQRKYVDSLKVRYAYTPQMVIDGSTDVVGSHRQEIDTLIQRHLSEHTKAPAITMTRTGDTLKVAIGAWRKSAPYDVVLVTFDKPHVTQVRRGENRGQTLKNSNVVRELTTLGVWSGKPTTYNVSLAGKPGNGGCAVLIQKEGQGPVLAAAEMHFPH